MQPSRSSEINLSKYNLDNFVLIKKDLSEQKPVIWAYGVDRTNRLVIIKKSDSAFDKIIFVVKRILGYINTSHASIQTLKQSTKQTIKNHISELKVDLETIHTDLQDKTYKVFEAKRSVDTSDYKRSEIETTIKNKQKELIDLEGRLKKIKDEEKTLEQKEQNVEKRKNSMESSLKDLTQKEQDFVTRFDEIRQKKFEFIKETDMKTYLTEAGHKIRELKASLPDMIANIGRNTRHDKYDSPSESKDKDRRILFADAAYNIFNYIDGYIVNQDSYKRCIQQIKTLYDGSEIPYNSSYYLWVSAETKLEISVINSFYALAELSFNQKKLLLLA